MSRGDAEAVAKQPHGIQYRPDPPAPLTIEQRVAALEARVAALEAPKAPEVVAPEVEAVAEPEVAPDVA